MKGRLARWVERLRSRRGFLRAVALHRTMDSGSIAAGWRRRQGTRLEHTARPEGCKGTVEELIALLGDTWTPERGWAAESLGRSGDPRALEPLARAVRASDWRMRWSAVAALGMLRAPGAVQPLIYALGDPHGWVRRTAARSLAGMGAMAVPALGPLRAALQSHMRASHARLGVHVAFLRAIRRIETAQGTGPTELIAASPPEGRGTEPEASSAPEGRGTELTADDLDTGGQPE